MTRKDFELIARNFKTFTDDCEPDQAELIGEFASSLAIYLKSTNPLFNTERFLKACGVETTDEDNE